MPKLVEEISRSDELKRGLKAIQFLATLAEKNVVVTLVYERPLETEVWRSAAQAMGKSLSVSLIGRSKGVKVVVGNDFVVESMEMSYGLTHTWKQVEGSFSNPNGHICKSTIEHICNICNTEIRGGEGGEGGGFNGDLLDLYCGNGNYTVPLSRFFRRILSVELNKDLVRVAKENMENNSCRNVSMVRSCCMKFSKNVIAGRGMEYRAYQKYDFSAILVDPPRAGLDPGTLQLAKDFDHIIYISCNADTLKTCLEELTQTHEVKSFMVFDHFPYTKFSECVVHLRKQEKIEISL